MVIEGSQPGRKGGGGASPGREVRKRRKKGVSGFIWKLETQANHLLRFSQALLQLNSAIVRSESREQIFHEACRVAVQVGQFPLAWVALLGPSGDVILPAAWFGQASDFVEGRQLPAGPENRGPVARCLRTGQLVLEPDFPQATLTEERRQTAIAHGLAAAAAVPLRDGERVIGALCLYAGRTEAFRPKSLELLERLGEDISYAIGNIERERRWAQAEGLLRVSERLFAATLDSLSASMCILDGRGGILASNLAWRRFQDQANLLVYGVGPGDRYLGRLLDLVARQDGLAGMASSSLEVILGTRESAVGEYPVGSGEARRWYATTITRFLCDGTPRIVVAHREITERRAADDRLRHSENLFRLIAENAQDLIALTDTAGRGTYFSPSHRVVLGYQEGEFEQQGPLALMHPEDREEITRSLRAIGEEGVTSLQKEVRLRCKDGAWKTFEAHFAVIPGEGEGPRQLLVVARDITARLEAERVRARAELEFRQAQKLESIGQLAAGIAHEINTPTQYIGDNTRFILESLGDFFRATDALVSLLGGPQPPPEAALQAVRQTLAEVDLEYLRKELPKAAEESLEGLARISKIVGAMKEFSHPGGEEKTLADLNRAIESTVAISRNEWKYVADLETDLDPELPPIPCYPGEINQVVLNLIVNAAHAIGDVVKGGGARGSIRIRTRREGDRAVIQVEDTGAGIPEAIRTRIFDPFFTTKEVGKGSGQGLAISHSVVVDKHAGTIDFVSAPGAGTVFTVRLPLASGD